MEKYCVSQSLAKRLKERGYVQNGQFYWRIPRDLKELDKNSLLCTRDSVGPSRFFRYIAAPLSDELLEQLPARLDRKDRSSWNLTIWKTEKNLDGDIHYSADYTEGMTVKMLVGKIWLEQDKLADALALLWLYCKENGLLEGAS